MSDYLPRLADDRLSHLLSRFAAISIVGPRASGKTTMARRLAHDIVRLDRPTEATAFESDPDVALAHLATPALLDEWREVPQVLGAVKRAVDDASGTGRFILTGSVRAELDAATWPGTGHLIRLPVTTLSERELARRTSGGLFLDALADGRLAELAAPDPWNLNDYLNAAVRGGFPEPALTLAGPDRQDWLDSHLDQLVTRDAPTLGTARDPLRLRRYLEVMALNSASMPTDTALAQAAGVDRRTSAAYAQLLSNLLVLDAVPAWTSNRLSRLVRTPKYYLTDSSLMAGAVRVDAPSILRDGDLLGRVIDTFVMAQLRTEVPLAQSRPQVFHARERDGRREVDIVLEFSGRRIAGIEVKSTSAPARSHASHLEWLRDAVGERFVGGVVLHTGTARIQYDESLWALPISSIWS